MCTSSFACPILFAWTFTQLWEGLSNSYADSPRTYVLVGAVLVGTFLIAEIIVNKNPAAGIGLIAVVIGTGAMLGYFIPNSQREAITRALYFDKSIAAQVRQKASFGEVLFGLSETSKAGYLKSLKQVPLKGCPEDFTNAYRGHIAAWESRNSPHIESSWKRVLNTAHVYGVELNTDLP